MAKARDPRLEFRQQVSLWWVRHPCLCGKCFPLGRGQPPEASAHPEPMRAHCTWVPLQGPWFPTSQVLCSATVLSELSTGSHRRCTHHPHEARTESGWEESLGHAPPTSRPGASTSGSRSCGNLEEGVQREGFLGRR